ncbi:MAG TPA: tetratricopeptide repeat protein, partial [Gemmataceae bacterium]|nr:tetratricopeptide repeat protein [Gemmataceae bacterium]
IMAICAALGISLWILARAALPDNTNMQFVILMVPAAIFYLYTRRILPGLRVFKHVLRGISYANVGQIRPALISLGRALQLDPNHDLAREQLWNVHRLMDFTQVVHDPDTLALINFDLCVDRAATLLLASKPKPEHLAEAYRLLDLTASQRPMMTPRCDYWRAVALTHEKQFGEAARTLERVITGEGADAGNPYRRAMLFNAWQLAVMLHPELTSRVGVPQLAVPGRRMQAIAAAERRLADNPEEAGPWELKRVLYNDLTEEEYQTHVIDGKPPDRFDHAFALQLGMGLVTDPELWRRGCEYLRIAAKGLPTQGPTIYLTIANASEKAGDTAGVWEAYETIKRIGRNVGPKNLTTEDRHTYFAVVKALAEDAAKRGDTAAAIDNYRLFTEYERAGANTYRTLADLYEQQGDAWAALHATEQGLVYDTTDKDFLARKDRYYYSVKPSELQARLDQVRKWFDVAYCKQKARWLLDHQGEDLDLLDWSTHLADLAQIMEPSSMMVRVLRARMLRRRGETDQAIALLEEVRGSKPEKFPNNEEEEAWFQSCRLLGDMYLNIKPDLSIACFQEYRKHGKSGADTIYKMGVAYENLADFVKARKCYETVAAYEDHPLAHEANSALHRLQTT